MNIYLVSQTVAKGYDTCSDMVVVAENEEEARNIHPCQHPLLEDWSGMDDDFNYEYWLSNIWAKNPSQVSVKLIGTSVLPKVKNPIICYSFHAG